MFLIPHFVTVMLSCLNWYFSRCLMFQRPIKVFCALRDNRGTASLYCFFNWKPKYQGSGFSLLSFFLYSIHVRQRSYANFIRVLSMARVSFWNYNTASFLFSDTTACDVCFIVLKFVVQWNFCTMYRLNFLQSALINLLSANKISKKIRRFFALLL